MTFIKLNVKGERGAAKINNLIEDGYLVTASSLNALGSNLYRVREATALNSSIHLTLEKTDKVKEDLWTQSLSNYLYQPPGTCRDGYGTPRDHETVVLGYDPDLRWVISQCYGDDEGYCLEDCEPRAPQYVGEPVTAEEDDRMYKGYETDFGLVWRHVESEEEFRELIEARNRKEAAGHEQTNGLGGTPSNGDAQ